MIDSEISCKMVVKEIDSFIQKFHQLWSAGVSAHLDLDTHAGEAWVGLRVQLGHGPAHLNHNLLPQPAQKVVAEQAAEEPTVKATHKVNEFCCNAEYTANSLSDEHSVRYRFLVKEAIFCSDIEVFKSKVRQNFVNAHVDISNQLFEISGYEQLNDQSKFYLKIKNDAKAIEAIKNMKSEDILMRKIPHKKPNS